MASSSEFVHVRPEKLKSQLEKEEECLMRVRELIEKQLAVLKVSSFIY